MIKKIYKIGTEHCSQCKLLAKELQGFNLVPITEIDAEEDEDFCEANHIRNIPVLLFENEKAEIVDRHNGFIRKDDLISRINNLNETN